MEQDGLQIVPLRATEVGVPLFCVHAGGGDAFGYRALAAAMPKDQAVYAFSPPELRRTNQFPTVEELASIYLNDVRKIQRQGPYQICGQSFGGLVAYEMASQLLGEGEVVHLVALFDTLHPAYCRNLPAKRLFNFHVTYLGDRFKKYAGNLLSGRLDYVVADALRLLRRNITRVAWQATHLAARALNRPIPEVMHTNALLFDAAWRVYTPKRFRGKLVLFRSETRTPEYNDDLTLGWRVCSPDIEVHIVPGDHVTMMKPPHVTNLVDKLTPYLVDLVGRESAG